MAQVQKVRIFAYVYTQKENCLGTTSVVVVNKHNGIYSEIHTIGVGKDQTEIDSLCLKGLQWIESSIGNG